MNYVINMTASNFSRQLDEVAALNLASVSGLFESCKYRNSSSTSEQTIRNFQVDQPFSWQCLNLFLGLFFRLSRCLIWEIGNIVEFIQICNYFMVNKRFLIDLFRASFPPNYCQSFRENQFCELLFPLKVSGFLFLARSLMFFASNLEDDEIFVFGDLMTARSPFDFRSLIENRLYQLQEHGSFPFCVFVKKYLLVF
jgi:hypothetical protein